MSTRYYSINVARIRLRFSRIVFLATLLLPKALFDLPFLNFRLRLTGPLLNRGVSLKSLFLPYYLLSKALRPLAIYL